MTRLLRWPGHAWISLPVRLYLAWVFILACLHKIADPYQFAIDVATYQFLPLWAINAMAIVLPWTELFVGVLLVVGWKVRPAALLVAGMMVMFMVALAWALTHDLQMSCGCFASQAMDEDPIGATTVLRDLSWLALGVYIVLFDREAIGLEQTLSPPMREPDAVT